jgi:hypothetical protein
MANLLAQRQIRMSVVAALQGANLGVTILSPGDWSTAVSDLPAILVRAPDNNKNQETKALPNFDSDVVVEVEAKVQATTAEDAQDAIEGLGAVIEQALFTDYVLNRYGCNTRTRLEISSAGKEHFGALKMTLTYGLFEEFVVADSPVLSEINLHLDAIQPFDASGTYPSPAFPGSVAPAPRSAGPDGRDEGGLTFTFPP